jgi:RNA polymerase sigma-70 factor (ECF subfamily)
VSDAEVIRSSLAEAGAFAVIFDRHFPAVHRFLRGRIGRQLAEDLAAETFIVAFVRRGSYDLSRDDARPWLYGIAVNLLREHRRAEERRLRAYARLPADDTAATDRLGGRLDPSVSAALLELSHEERNLILLLTWADLTYEQLADALGVPVGTIRSRISRVRAKLRVSLAPVETSVQAEGSGLA